MTEGLRLLVYPRDLNPYQESLYEELEHLGVDHRYVGELTASHTLNLALLPFELAALRLRGFRCLHLHWLFGFSVTVAAQFPSLRKLLRWYFVGVLSLCRVLGIGVVWTAHNVVPHRPVFDDDLAARKSLTEASSAVIAHSPSTLAELEALGCVLGETAVIPPGTPRLAGAASGTGSDRKDVEAIETDGRGARLRCVFIGKVEEHKGLEGLLDLLANEDDPPFVSLVIAGECRDGELASSLRCRAARSLAPIELRLWYQTDEELADVLRSGDVAVFPFRKVTSSSSVLTALAAGRPVIIPKLGELADVPNSSAWHYDPDEKGLASVLRAAASSSRRKREEMSERAIGFARRSSWATTARATLPILKRAARLEGANDTASATGENVKVSFIVVNWREDEATRACVASIKSTARDIPVEIVVVDNEGAAGDRAKDLGEGVVVIRNARNRGFAGGVNDGLRRASGAIVAVLNNDCRLSKGWLEAGMAALEDPAIGLAGGPEFAWDEEGERGDSVASPRTTVTVDTSRGFTVLGGSDLDRARAVGSLNGSNLIARREVLERLGGFEERFFTYYEDADLCARALALGYTLFYEPDMVIWHRRGLTSKRRPFRAAYLARRNHLLFVARNFPHRSWHRAVLNSCLQYLGEAACGSTTGLKGRAEKIGRLDRTERSAGLVAVAWALVSWPELWRSRSRLVRSGQHDEKYLQKLDALQRYPVVGVAR